MKQEILDQAKVLEKNISFLNSQIEKCETAFLKIKEKSDKEVFVRAYGLEGIKILHIKAEDLLLQEISEANKLMKKYKIRLSKL